MPVLSDSLTLGGRIKLEEEMKVLEAHLAESGSIEDCGKLIDNVLNLSLTLLHVTEDLIKIK